MVGQWEAPAQLDHDPTHLVWASSPDRGLHHLVDIFKLVKDQVSEARLTVCYDFDRAYASYHNSLPGSVFCRWLEKAAELKEMDGVEVLQHITQPALAKLFTEAGLLVYPCDPVRETETYCVTVNEAMAAGMPVVLSDADCLPENYGDHAKLFQRPIDHAAWARSVVQLMTDPERYQRASACSLALARQTDYSLVAGEWEAFFSEFLAGQETTSDRSLAARLGR
jgi:glycosyltransferase involved in cell wall biosynthesis